MRTKHYPVRMLSVGMDDFVMDEKTMKTTPGVAGLQSVATTTDLDNPKNNRALQSFLGTMGENRFPV